MYVESSPTPPPCGDCAVGRETKHCSLTPSVDQRRSVPGSKQDDEGGRKPNHHTNAPQFQEKSKISRGQNKWPNRRQKNCPFSSSCLPQLLTFAFLKSRSQDAFLPFHASSRTSFTAHIAISFLFNRDSGLQASEARYKFVSL